ncbi:uncharacterized protein LOC121959222 [Plectropomus leopardus]|uniref:uncharacterized protein LOC121959222 n=1 Tax=Plectropomus leopardus TaxID=160734 RepID=UPI001C4B3517|nr:uncharacterized protein LOC121959222 [Plectropomus leopardus]
MKAHWWSCVLGLLCMHAEVTLSTWTVSQEPSSISLIKVNSSFKITCSTSRPDPSGFYLHRRFHGKKDVVYLSLDNGEVTKNTITADFLGRIHVTREQQINKGHGFTLHLSLLGVMNTDFYYCSWKYLKSETATVDTLSSNGTIIIVTERDPHELCRSPILDLVFIALSVTAFTIAMILLIGTLIARCKRFKKQFRPARAPNPPRRPNRPQRPCPQQPIHHCPYLVTSVNTLDFRGIL